MGRNIKGSLIDRSTIIQNLKVCDLFSMLSKMDFASYTDDYTSHIVKGDVKEAIESLERAIVGFFKWFSNNEMKVNA